MDSVIGFHSIKDLARLIVIISYDNIEGAGLCLLDTAGSVFLDNGEFRFHSVKSSL